MSFPLGSLLGGEDAASEAASPTKPVRRQTPKRDVAPPSAGSRLLRTPLWLALTAILIGLTYWRTRADFLRHAFATNACVMACGFLLGGYQLSGYVMNTLPHPQ